MRRLPARLRAYARWVQTTWIQSGGTGVVVLIDEDRQDCKRLKAELEDAATVVGLPTKSSVEAGTPFVVLNRVVVEELEAWFLGDCDAIRSAYPRVPGSIERRAAYRQPDEIRGGTWEALERPGLLRCRVAPGHGVDEVVWAVVGASGGAGDVGLT